MEVPSECEYKKRIRKEDVAVPIAAIIIIIILGILMTPMEYLEDDDCSTKICKNESSRLFKKINLDINPCDDFYKFACGGNYLRSQISERASTDDLRKQTQWDILKLYKEPIREKDHLIVNYMKMLFRACKDANTNDGENSTAVIQDVSKILANGKEFDWISMTHKLRDLGLSFGIFLDVVVDDDPRDRNKGILKIKTPKRSKINPEALENVLVQLGQNQTANYTEEAEETSRLSDLLSRDDSNQYRIYTISDLHVDIPSINWLDFIGKIVSPFLNITSNKYEVSADLRSLKTRLNIISNAPKRIQANYAIWMILQDLSPLLPSKLQNQLQTNNGDLSDNDSPEEFCSQFLQRLTPNPMIIIYTKNQLSHTKSKLIQDVFTSIKTALYDRMDRNRKFSKVDRDNIKAKLTNMDLIIGEPLTYLQDDFFNQLLLTEDGIQADAISNALKLFRFLNRNFTSYMFSTINKSKLDRSSNNGNHMYYDIKTNVLHIPPTQIQDMSISDKMPNYVIFGTFGKKIAEQLSLLLRFSTSIYDKDGRAIDEWTRESATAAQKSAVCLEGNMDQFNWSDYSYLSKEFESQAISVKLSYDAYKKWVKTNSKDITLATYYNEKQLFWIWTAVCHQEDYSYLVTRNPSLSSYHHTNIHDLLDFPRIATYAIARNNVEFKKDFKCSSKTLMAASKKCLLV